MYSQGKGVVQNKIKAFEWVSKAAEQGDADAQSYLGTMYLLGNGVLQNKRTAFDWHSKAAEQGIAGSQFVLGTMYSSGEGVKKDNTKALKWFSMAAEQGYADAQSRNQSQGGQSQAADLIHSRSGCCSLNEAFIAFTST